MIDVGQGRPSLITRPAGPDDARLIAEILVAEGLGSYRAWAPPTWRPPAANEDQVHRLANMLRDPQVWCMLALADDGPAGHVSLSPRTKADPKPPPPGTFNLWQLFVRPRWQASGVADVLMDAAVAEAQRRGISRLRLWTPRDHARARAFYERQGWKGTGGERDDPSLGLTIVEYARAVDSALR